MEPGLVSELTGILGPDHVLTDRALTAGYGTDWTRRYLPRPDTVVLRPADTEELAAVVAACRRRGQPMVPQGGNTGLVGGSVPHTTEAVLSLARLTRLDPVDQLAGTVTVGAGVSLAALQQHAAAAGWRFGVDTASRDSATVGGLVATNAGGTRVLRYGDLRAQLVGVEAVLGTGELVSRLDRPAKDNTGYHLPGLLCGSEGTLGAVTAVTLRLHPEPGAEQVALLAFASPAAAVAAIPGLRAALPGLAAVELLLGTGLALVCAETDLPPPWPDLPAAVLLVASTDGVERLAAAVSRAAPLDAQLATDPADRRRLWAYRERHTEAIAAAAARTGGPVLKLDVTVPLRELAHLVGLLSAEIPLTAPGARPVLFGHAADGNVHVNVLGAGLAEPAVTELVLTAVERLHGSISSEHGIGVLKRRWLARTRGAAEIAVFRRLKQAFDPDHICNPAVLLPAPAPSPA